MSQAPLDRNSNELNSVFSQVGEIHVDAATVVRDQEIHQQVVVKIVLWKDVLL